MALTPKSPGPGAIIADMRSFMVISFILILGFATAFAINLPTHPVFSLIFTEEHPKSIISGESNNLDPGAASISVQALITTFRLLMGDFDINDFQSKISICFLVIYMLLNVVVLLNLLIAIMGDSYERVKMNEVFETYHSQALTICKYERFYFADTAATEDSDRFPAFVHAMEPGCY